MKKTNFIFIFIFFILTAGFFYFWSKRLPKPESATDDASVETPIRVDTIYGDAAMKTTRNGAFVPLSQGFRLPLVAWIKTIGMSNLVLHIHGEPGVIEIGGNSELEIGVEPRTVKITLMQGEVYSSVHGDRAHHSLQVRSGTLVAESDNADFLVRTTAQEGPRADVYRGRTNVFSSRKSFQLSKDQFFTVRSPRPQNFDFQILTPLAYDHVNLTGDQSPPIRFAWSNLPSDIDIELQVGSTPQKLTPISIERLDMTRHEFIAHLDPGIWYWKLIASVGKGKKRKTWSSSIYKIFVQPEQSVQLLEPLSLLPQVTVKRLGGVFFRWSNPSRLERLLLEVSRTSDFESKLLRQPLVGEQSEIISLDGEGKFYWRINGFRQDSSELLTSSTGAFEITSSSVEPQVIWPAEGEKITKSSLQRSEVWLEWRSAPLTQYEVVVNSLDAKDFKSIVFITAQDRVLLPILRRGSYRVSVKVKNAAQGEERHFDVVESQILNWTPELTKSVTAHTSHLSWSSGPSETTQYRLRIWSLFPLRDGLSNLKEILLTATSWNLDLPDAGVYVAQVQALGPSQKILSESAELVVEPNP